MERSHSAMSHIVVAGSSLILWTMNTTHGLIGKFRWVPKVSSNSEDSYETGRGRLMYVGLDSCLPTK